jgi:RHS repeat-associated protein
VISKYIVILYAAGCLLSSLESEGQTNTVSTWSATAPDPDPNHLVTRPLSDVKQVSQYFDGIGRLVQTVAKQGSLDSYTNPSAPVQGDLIAQLGYDNIGRQNVSYLPYVSTTSTDGSYKSTALTDQPNFYTGTYILSGQGETGVNAHALTNFEVSPLNRPVSAMAPGNNWVGSGKGVQSGYWNNTVADGVIIWNVTNSPLGSFGTYSSAGAYPPGTLYKKITTDENGNQVIEFRDIEGKVILKKVANGSSDNGLGTGYTAWLCTYYIYDILGNLRCLIQPAGVAALSGNGWTLTAAIVAQQCFLYEYDQRNRMVIKQVPGAQPVYMVYDNLDRLVMNQDGNMRGNSKWLVTVYDNLNRPIQTGLLNDANGLATEIGNAYNSTSYPSTASGFELLTVTHYDDYTNLPTNSPAGLTSTFQNTWNSSFSATNLGAWPYPMMPVQNSTYATKNLVTWSQAEVLGTNGGTYLTSVNIYDDKGRLIQAQNQNYSGGIDVTTTQYAWNGQALVVMHSQQKAGTNPQTNTVQSSLTYDVLIREVSITKTFAGPAGTVTKTLVNNTYDQLGQLHTKTLGPTSSSTGGAIDMLTYDYNIRGWLLGINRNYLNSATTIAITNAIPAPGNYFGEELAYDKLTSYSPMTYAAAQLNGNIAGSVWKSTGDAVPRKYDFTYDQANRLTAANFAQITPSNGQAVDYFVGLAYDANGNILAMNQKGYRLGSPTGLIDELVYTYYSGSNQLRNVVDAVNNSQTISGDFRSSSAYMTALGNNKTGAAYDYAYDNNGNLTTDQNKDIGTLNNSTGAVVNAGIVFNYLNLPQTITFNNNKGTIKYVYDAGGTKLQKITSETSGSITYNGTTYTGVQITTTTTYIGGFVYQSISYPNNSTLNASPLQHGDILQFVGHEEGRIRPLYNNLTNSNTVTGYAFDYFLKDHLGNTRMVLTDEQATDPTYLATMETGNSSTEQLLFANLPQTRVAKPGGFDNNSSNQSVALTNYTTNKLGPSLVLKVMAGDMLSISVNAYYNATSGNNYTIGTLAATDLLTNLLSTATGVPALGNAHATLTDLQNNSGVLGTAGQGFLNSRTPPNSGVPKAYLNYIFLDDQFQFAGGYASPITSACASSAQSITAQYPQVAVPKNGYVYVYVSNESNYNVYFDNLQVIYRHGPILEDNAYYPFGLTMAGISDKAVKTQYAQNKYRYNGKELQNQEFSDGGGLEWYEYGERFFDDQIGRWQIIDPLAYTVKNNSYSPYSFVKDNPIVFVDPNGADWFYYQAKDEKTRSWHFQEGHKATYTNAKGKEVTTSHGYGYLITFKATGKNSEGGTVGTLTVYNQDKVAVTVNAFSGSEVYGLSATAKGNYFVNLSQRDSKGPTEMNEKKDNPLPFMGIQAIPHRYINISGSGTNDDQGGYDIQGAYGHGRMRLLETDADNNVSSDQVHGYYIHGKLDAHNWTHGCICNKSEEVFNYFWSGGGKDVRAYVPVSVQ